MAKPLPPLGWLRTFEASARTLSFTAAARDLNMTQSAVSQQVKSLEAYLGRALFHRRPRVLELTEAGRTYLPVVRDAFATLAQGTRAVVGETEQRITVHSNISFAVQWLAPRLPRFRARYPDLRLSIMAEIWEPHGLAAGIDVEIRFALRPPESPRAELLCREAVYPVCAPCLDISMDTLPLAQLYDCANLLSNWPHWAEHQGLDWVNPRVTYASTYLFCLSIVQMGGGVMLGHDMICRDLIESGTLIRPFPGDLPMAEGYYLMISEQGSSVPGVAEFASWLREEMEIYNGRDGTQA